MHTTLSTAVLITSLAIVGCSASQHRAEVEDAATQRLTVGTVQREIRHGMAAADVIAVLGSPNIVTSSANQEEVWVYDRIATDATYSRSAGAVVGLIVGPLGSGSAGGLGAGSRAAGATSVSQRSLTVVINFDGDSRVADFAYHASRF